MHALISIHDVMPDTLAKVEKLAQNLGHLERAHITLLVVPGLHWEPFHIERLHALATQGFTLAGHGWLHTTRGIRGLYHRLHSLFLSRHAAEHLSLGAGDIRQLMLDCHLWFEANGFMTPDLYVPPAWAMGPVGKDLLQEMPFRYFEDTRGIYDSETGKHVVLPLAGYQADTLFRQVGLGLWNGVNAMMATPARPLRIAIHPHDDELKLKNALSRIIARVSVCTDYHSLFSRHE